MAVIEGQIEPLKKIKNTLDENGISQFNSIKDINVFIDNFEEEKSKAVKLLYKEIEDEITQLEKEIFISEAKYDLLKKEAVAEIHENIKGLNANLDKTIKKQQNNFFIK
jgi:predicted nucleic acid-binding protein